MPSQIVLASVPEQIKKQYTYSLDESPFYKPFTDFPDEFDTELKQNLSNNGKAVIKKQIYPAFEELERFFTHEYLPNARQDIGASSMPNGLDYYQFRVKNYTTTDLTIQEIHDIGLSEVDRIHKEMEKIISDLDFEGSFSEFLTCSSRVPSGASAGASSGARSSWNTSGSRDHGTDCRRFWCRDGGGLAWQQDWRGYSRKPPFLCRSDGCDRFILDPCDPALPRTGRGDSRLVVQIAVALQRHLHRRQHGLCPPRRLHDRLQHPGL